MRSHEMLHQLARIQSPLSMRERRARVMLGRATNRHDALTRSLVEITEQIDALEQERDHLFTQCIGPMTRGELFRLRLKESILESRRIGLMLDRVEIESSLAEAEAASKQARDVLIRTRRKSHKFGHVMDLVLRDIERHYQSQEDIESEERRYKS